MDIYESTVLSVYCFMIQDIPGCTCYNTYCEAQNFSGSFQHTITTNKKCPFMLYILSVHFITFYSTYYKHLFLLSIYDSQAIKLFCLSERLAYFRKTIILYAISKTNVSEFQSLYIHGSLNKKTLGLNSDPCGTPKLTL